MSDPKLTAWLKSGKYLPPILRDFHDQKDCFKWMDRFVQNKIRSGSHHLDGYNWVQFHCLTIDFFLWYMAVHGYTLQRTRKPLPFGDWKETMKAFDAEQLERLKQTLQAARNE